MRKMLRRGFFLLIAWCLVIPGNSQAEIIQRIYSIGTLTNIDIDSVGVTPFDPTLGTLNEVRVSILESVVFTGIASPGSYIVKVD